MTGAAALSLGMMTQLTLVASAVAGAAIPWSSSTAAAQPTPICTAVPSGAALIVPLEDGVAVTTADGSEVLDVSLPATPSVAARGPDGTVWAEVPTGGEMAEVYRIAPGGDAASVASGEVMLASVGWLDGQSAAVVIDRTVRADQIEDFGAVIVDYADGRQVNIKPAGAPEYEAMSVTIGGGLLVEGARADLTEAFLYYRSDGTMLEDWFDPTDAAPYGEPPQYQWPMSIEAQPGDMAGHVLSWVEGPDWDVTTDRPVGAWTMVLADAASGEERARVDLGEPGGALTHADFHDLRWVGSFESRVVVFDLNEPAPAVVDPGCPAGMVATIDRLGAPAPAQPSTTVQPTTTAPVCPTYEPNDQYPLRLCDEGQAVRAIQQALAAAGHGVDVDGYFGPLTEAEVRRFQQAHDLEVDGLVGDDTWAALMPFAPPEGTDSDGSGIVDPWELAAHGPTREDVEPAQPRGDAASYIGLVYVPSASDQAIADANNVIIPELVWRGGAAIGDADAPLHVLEHVADDDEAMLWLSRSEGRDADGHPLPWTVRAAIDVPLGPGQFVAFGECLVDGARSTAIAAVVTGEVDESNDYIDVAAWSFDVATESITSIDPARVVCPAIG